MTGRPRNSRRAPSGSFDPVECAWAAGFFDGEGSIRIGQRRAFGQLCVEIGQIDIEPLRLCQRRWGGKIHYRPRNAPLSRDYHRWTIWSRQAALFITQLMPYFRRPIVIRRAKLALKFQAQKSCGTKRKSTAYKARQIRFFIEMRELNRRGCR